MDVFSVVTDDGSKTLFSTQFGEHFHSKFGAITESMHVFIESGLLYIRPERDLKVLEIGFGTGLNALLTAKHASKPILYTAIEAYPLPNDKVKELNYDAEMGEGGISLADLHEAGWGQAVEINDRFVLRKIESKLEEAELGSGYDVVFFDAFAPDVQPELWTAEIFRRIYDAMVAGGVMTTYSAKGQVRRNMIEAGFEVERIPGPPGKRQMLRANK
jgi:tRNA U34 5-methylaminomethyl-2-thiouridine-forming methyltransferase MnmC